MFSRHTPFRQQSGPPADGDPLTASADASEEQIVGAINRMAPVSESSRAGSRQQRQASSGLYGKHEVLKELRPSAASLSQQHQQQPDLPPRPTVSENSSTASTGSFPSTGFSRSRKTSRQTLKANAPPKAATGADNALGITAASAEGDGKAAEAAPEVAETSTPAAEPLPDNKSPGDAHTDSTVGLLPHDSLGRLLWMHLQVAPDLADLRDLIADNPTGILILPQSPYRGQGEPDLGSIINDNVLFTDSGPYASEAEPAANSARKFTTSSGICGTVDRGSVNALGMLPPMENIMHAISESDSPRTTIFDVLDDSLMKAQPLVRLRVIAIHGDCALPDNRHVQVAVTSGPLERRLVVDSAVTTLSARIYEKLEATYKVLLPLAAEAITADDHIKVDIERIMQYAHSIELSPQARAAGGGSGVGSAPRKYAWIAGQRASRSSTPASSAGAAADTPDVDTQVESWQSYMSQLQDHILAYLARLEQETSICGDSESRKKIAVALVECVEKLVTEAVYAKIFSPWLSDDRVQDEQFASKVAALNIAEIKLEHLGLATTPETVADLHRICGETGRLFESMNAAKSPAEKLKLVVDAHKNLVDRMDRLNEKTRSARRLKQRSEKQQQQHDEGAGDSESDDTLLSADSILPLLIYSVVKANPPRFISNLRYIQRYRTRALLTSQFEYCMTNAQAAASFVSSVDARKLGLSAEVSSSALERVLPPALVSLQNLLLNNVVSSVGIDVVQGVADGGKKVAVGVYDATLGKLIDTSSQFILRAPWRSPSERELQQGTRAEAEDDAKPLSEKTLDATNVISGVKNVLSDASEQLSHEIKGHLPRGSPRSQRQAPQIHERFMGIDAGDLTINDVAQLLASYKELAAYLCK